MSTLSLKKERLPLTPDNCEQLESWNKIWYPAAIVLVRLYLAGIGLAFAVIIGVSYFGKWNDMLGFFMLVVIAACVYQIIRIVWKNILRSLDIFFNRKYRVEIPKHLVIENNGEYSVRVPGIRKPVDISAETASNDLLVEYAPISKTLLLITSLC